ncbi:MAG: hypothetical protein KDA84_07815 [Planctomycetaceae bacterium]|nr:hypothetical protein [Planctomycetaceae bacterium]
MQSESLFALRRIARWANDPNHTEQIALDPRAEDVLLLPQTTWTLLALMHYQQLKRWAWKMIKTHLPNFLAAVRSRSDTLVTIDEVLEVGSSGFLPGMPEWRFNLEGDSFVLTHRVTEERIDVDVFSGPDVIESQLFCDYLIRHRPPRSCRAAALGVVS